jgi:hypothetical protein
MFDGKGSESGRRGRSLAPAEAAQGGCRHDHLSTERTGDAPHFGCLAPERDNGHSVFDLAPRRRCAGQYEGVDSAVAARQEIMEAAKTFLRRIDLLKRSGPLRVVPAHGISRLL